MEADDLTLAEHGAMIVRQVLDAGTVAELDASLGKTRGRPGCRVTHGLQTLLGTSEPLGRLAADLLGPRARPVRAVVFDKTPQANWAVAWHQDRTIAVRERIETDGFGPWSIKGGIVHVAPPMAVLNGMLTVRLHLDGCSAANAPLQIALGSHRIGRVAADQAGTVALRHDVFACLARAGDAWVYSTPILHASERARTGARRRVLQVDFAAADLPNGLSWLGVG